MKKLKSSMVNMVVVLTLTTALAGFLLAYVNGVTEGPRMKAESDKREAAIRSVIGRFDNDPIAERATFMLPDGKTEVTVYPAIVDGDLKAAAIESRSLNGFSGEITLMTGIDIDGNILGYEVTRHAETPGLGAKMNEWFRSGGKRDIAGHNPWEKPLKVSKDNGEIDAITAATISSRAFLEAVNTAADGWSYYINNEYVKK